MRRATGVPAVGFAFMLAVLSFPAAPCSVDTRVDADHVLAAPAEMAQAQSSPAVSAYVHVETIGRFETPYEAGRYYNEPLSLFSEDVTLGRRAVHVVEGAGRRVVGLGVHPGTPGLMGTPVPGLAFNLGDIPTRHLASAAVDPRATPSGQFGPRAGALRSQTGAIGPPAGALGLPAGALGPSARVLGSQPARTWLVDDTTHQVIAVDASGGPVLTLGVESDPGRDDAHFDSPTGIAVDGAGRVFVSDTGNDRIQVFTTEGAFLGTLGPPGTVLRPRDIVISSDGKLWVADSGHGRAVLLDPADLASPGVVLELGTDVLVEPVGIASMGSFVYVADAGACNVKIFYRGSGGVQATLGSHSGRCSDWAAGPPSDVSPVETSVYVTYPRAHVVAEYQLRERGGWNDPRVVPSPPYIPVEGLSNEPVQAARVGGDALVVLERAGNRLLRVESDGYVSWSFGSAGNAADGDAGLSAPSDFAIGPGGEVYVADTGNDRVVHVGSDGSLVGEVLTGMVVGQPLAGPSGIDVADDGRLAAADPDNDRVLLLDPTSGQSESRQNAGGMDFSEPSDVAFTADGLVIADTGNHRVVAVRSDWSMLWTAGSAGVPGDAFDQLNSPGQVAVGSDGRVAVADTGNDRVQIFDASGTYLTTLGGLPGEGGGALREPWGLAFWDDGLLSVADTAQHQVQVFAPAVEPYLTDWRPENVNGHGDRAVSGTSAMVSWGDSLWSSAFRRAPDGPITEMRRLSADRWRRVPELDLDGLVVSDMQEWRGELWLAATGGGEGSGAAGGLLHTATGTDLGFVPDLSPAIGLGGGTVALFADVDGVHRGLHVGLTSGGPAPSGQLWHSATGGPGTWARLTSADDLGSSATAVTAMAVMSGTLYAGTCSAAPGEMWRSEDRAAWERVAMPAVETEDGDESADVSVCVASAAAFGDYLYASTNGGRVWRCALCDGTDWEEATPVDLDPDSSSGVQPGDQPGDQPGVRPSFLPGAGRWSALRRFASDPFEFLYLAVGTSGLGGTSGSGGTSGPAGIAVFRTLDGGAWEPATADGWGDVSNSDVYGPASMVEHRGRLYVASLNFAHGTEIWSTSGRPTKGGATEPPAAPTPRPWTAPPEGPADYVVEAKWPRSDVASTNAVGDVVDSALASDGTVYLADATNGRIAVLAGSGDRGAPIYPGGGARRAVGYLGAMALDESRGRIYLADIASSRLVVIDLAGQVQGVWRDVHAAAVQVAPDGTVWVADRGESAIRRFDSSGAELQRFGDYGKGSIPFGRLVDLHVASGSELYVLDRQEKERWSGSYTNWRVTRIRDSGSGWEIRGQVDLEGQRCAGGTGNFIDPLAELPDRMTGLPDGSVAVARCVLTDMRRSSSALPETYPKHDLISARLRSVDSTGRHFAALAVRDLTPQAYDDGWLGVVRFGDAFLTPTWFGRLARLAPAPGMSGGEIDIVDPAMMSLDSNDQLVVAAATNAGTWTRDGEPQGSLPTSFYPSRTTRCVVDPLTVRPVAETGTAMGLCTEFIGPPGNPKELARVFKARVVARRRCTRVDGLDVCKVSDYLEPIWMSSLPHGTQWRLNRIHELQVQYAAVDYDPMFDRYLVLQNYVSSPNEVSTHVAVFAAEGYGGREYMELPDDSRHAVWEDVDAGPDGRVYVLEALTDRVFMYGPDLQLEAMLQPPHTAWQVAGGPADDVFYLDVYGTVVRTSHSGDVLSRFDGRPHGGVSATSLTDLEVDRHGWAYTSDRDADQISVFRPVQSESSARDTRDCSFVAEKVAAPRQVVLGDAVDLLLQIYGACGYEEEPTDLVVAVNTHKMSWYGKPRSPGQPPPPNPNGIASDVARRIVAGVDFSRHRVGVVAFSGSYNIESALTTDTWQLASALASPYAGRSAPRLYSALRGALEVFERGSPNRKVLVIVDPASADTLAVEAAHRLRSELDAHIVTVNGRAPLVADSDLSDGIELHPVAAGSTRAVQPFLLHTRRPDRAARDIEITDVLPANMEYVPGSATSGGAWDAASRRVTWRVAAMTDFERPTVRLQVRPKDIGRWPTNVEARALLTDGWGKQHQLLFPIPHVLVYDELPTATPQPTPTATASATPTATATATAIPTATTPPTATYTPRPLYLPVLLRTRACRPGSRNADVALVIDTSVSMGDSIDPGGSTKLEGAVDAARVFLELLVPGPDQAALVQFNDTAKVVVGLTDDIDALMRGLMRLSQASGTRIDRALDVASAELAGSARRPGNNSVLILLTDGRPSGVSPDDVRAAGRRARDAGVIVFTIGLGADVDSALLTDIATSPSHAFLAPQTEQLQGIYERIAYSIPCRPAWP